MKSKSNKPIVIKVGNVQVKIYRSARMKGAKRYEQFDVADYSSGKRTFISFSDERKARDKATEIATRLANREGDVLTLASTDRGAYLRALELLQPSGVALELAVAQFAEAHQKLGGRSLAAAVDDFIRRNPTTLPRKTVSDVFQEMLAAKETDGASAVHLRDLRHRAGKFVAAFHCQIASVSAAEINEFLRSLDCGPRTRNNYRLAVLILFRFAESAGYIHGEHVDFKKVAKAKEEHVSIGIFSPEEMSKLLSATRFDRENLTPGFNLRYAEEPGLLPLLLLGGFAGMRTAEIERQQWEDIKLERGFIRVTAAKGNTAQKRLIQPLAENLKQWLATCRRDSGLVCKIARTPAAISRLAKRAGVKWRHNALRHSFGSYRLAEIKSAAQVSLEMGNSPKMIFRHYRELVTEAEAKAWFSISPEQTANVVPMPASVDGANHRLKRSTGGIG